MVISKDRSLAMYLLENNLGTKINAGKEYKGGVTVKSITTNSYHLMVPVKLEMLFQKLVSVLEFLLLDYKARYDEFMDINIPEDTQSPLLRRSERKTYLSLSPNPIT